MHAPFVRVSPRLTAALIAAAAAATLAWSPVPAASGSAAGHDRSGPGCTISDSDGDPASSHGPPGMTVHGSWERYCAAPGCEGPYAAGGCSGPQTIEHWTSSVTGRVVAEVTTGANGTLNFDHLTPGSYRLHETDTGSRLHERVPDQDVTITEGRRAAANPLTVIDPFKQGELLVKKTDKAGRPLPGALITANAGTLELSGRHTRGREIAQLTTGKDGTAKIILEVTPQNGTSYWASETTPSDGYRADAALQRFTVIPGAQATATTPPSAAPRPATTPTAQLARTGAAGTAWLVVAGGVMVAVGAVAVWAGGRRRRRSSAPGNQ